MAAVYVAVVVGSVEAGVVHPPKEQVVAAHDEIEPIQAPAPTENIDHHQDLSSSDGRASPAVDHHATVVAASQDSHHSEGRYRVLDTFFPALLLTIHGTSLSSIIINVHT